MVDGGPGLAPMDEVGEVDVGGQILASDVLIDRGAFEALLEQVGAEGAVRAAMKKLIGGVSVVDGKDFSGLPIGHPGGEPVLIGVVDFDALADGEVDFPEG